MAIDFYKLGRQSGATTPKGQQSGLQSLVGSIDKTVSGMLEKSQAATAALSAAMPAGVAIDKVPEQLRGKVSQYLADNKKAYTDAAKVVASGINPQSQRYKDAIETMNRVGSKFENLSATLEDIAVKRKAALDDPSFSPATSKLDQLTFENLKNGSIYDSMNLNEDGTFSYTDGEGTSKAWSDFAVAKQNFIGQQTFIGLVENVKEQAKQEGATFENLRKGYQVTINSLFDKLGPKGALDYALADDEFLNSNPKFKGKDKDELIKNPNDVVQAYKEYNMTQLEAEFTNAPKFKKGFPGTKSDEAQSIKYNQAKKEYNEFINRSRIKYSDNNTKRESVQATPEEQIAQVYKSINPNLQIQYVQPESNVKDDDENVLAKGYYHKAAISENPDGTINYEYRPLSPGPNLGFDDVDHLIDYKSRPIR